jgi:hypothetical protein
MAKFVIIKDDKSKEFQPVISGQTDDYDRAIEIADETNFSTIKHLNKDAGKVGGTIENTFVVNADDIKGYNWPIQED